MKRISYKLKKTAKKEIANNTLKGSCHHFLRDTNWCSYALQMKDRDKVINIKIDKTINIACYFVHNVFKTSSFITEAYFLK